MAATELNPHWVAEKHIDPNLARYSPIGLLTAQLLTGMSDHALLAMHVGLWWFHLVLALGFIAAIPFTKLRHVFTTSTNAFLAPLEPKGSIATINLEDENVEQYGAAAITDLTWKDIFDADACTACKRCQDRCPAWATDKPLSPMKIVQQIGELAEANLRAGKGDRSNLPERPSGKLRSNWTSPLFRQPGRNLHAGRPLGLHHLPCLPGRLPGRHRTRQQDSGDEKEPGADGRRLSRRRSPYGRRQL